MSGSITRSANEKALVQRRIGQITPTTLGAMMARVKASPQVPKLDKMHKRVDKMGHPHLPPIPTPREFPQGVPQMTKTTTTTTTSLIRTHVLLGLATPRILILMKTDVNPMDWETFSYMYCIPHIKTKICTNPELVGDRFIAALMVVRA